MPSERNWVFSLKYHKSLTVPNINSLLTFYSSQLEEIKNQKLYRSPPFYDFIDSTTVEVGSKKLISFADNDYLGLSHNAEIKRASIEAIKKFGSGGRASRYITGNNSLYQQLEREIAELKNSDDAIVFSSGYSTSIGIIPALVKSGDLIITDRLIHSSLIDGSKLSGARLMRFRHNSALHCREILNSFRKKFQKCLIISETVFSMDGDLGPIQDLLDLAQEFNCLLISDDAHGLNTKPTPNPLHLQIGTFSKAYGSLGGYVAGDELLIDYLRNFSKSVIYSTSLPPSVLAASLAALKLSKKKNLAAKALLNAQKFASLMNISTPSSAIVPIIIGDIEKLLRITSQLKEKGFLVAGIRPPTVAPGKSRLRISFSAAHTATQIEELAYWIRKFYS